MALSAGRSRAREASRAGCMTSKHGGETGRHAGTTQGTHSVAEVALGEALVVRLGERLGRQQLVGYLGVEAVAVRVVDRVALRRPEDESATRTSRGIPKLFEREVVRLGIHRDRAV